MQYTILTHSICGGGRDILETKLTTKPNTLLMDISKYLQRQLLCGIIDGYVILQDERTVEKHAGIRFLN